MQYLAITWCITALFAHSLYASTLMDKIESAIKKELPYATISILVKDAKNGQLIVNKNTKKLLYPASTIKLFTATAALYHWQADHYFKTSLLKDKNNYYIRFGASPSLTSDNLSSLISDYFLQQGITQIKGSIVLDASIFSPPYHPAGISYDDLGWYYAAPDSAIILDENKASFKMTSGKLNEPVTFYPVNAQSPLTVLNQVITVNKNNSPPCTLNISNEKNNTVRLYGCAPLTEKPQLIELAIPEPEHWAQAIIYNTLQKNNIQLKGSIRFATTPDSAKHLVSLRSNSIHELINHMLKESDNLYADNLAKQLGYSLTKKATNAEAVLAIKQILAKHMILDDNQLELADGVGTRYNLASTKQISVLLDTIYHDKKLFSLFIEALPQSGVSGTLKNRMKNTRLEKIIYAKTGTMHDISALSGFMINPNGRPLIFSIIINGINQPIAKAKALEEQILSLIDEEVNTEMPEHSQFA